MMRVILAASIMLAVMIANNNDIITTLIMISLRRSYECDGEYHFRRYLDNKKINNNPIIISFATVIILSV